MNNKNNIDRVHDDVFNSIKILMDKARNEVAREVNNILVQTYWEIGRIIVEDEQGHSERAEYGKELINDLSRKLTKEYGKGFSKSNLFNMRNLYLSYPIFQTLSGKLTWSHYCELLSISDEKKRSFYEKESINANWSVRELKRQIKSSPFERLLLSAGEVNKKSPQMWAMIRYKILHINVVAIHRIQVVLRQVAFYLVDCSCVVNQKLFVAFIFFIITSSDSCVDACGDFGSSHQQ